MEIMLRSSFCKAENLLGASSIPGGSVSGPEGGLQRRLCNSEHQGEGCQRAFPRPPGSA